MPSGTALADVLIGRYGPVLNEAALMEVLHFASPDALAMAVRRGTLAGLPLFRIPGRPGIHALAQELAVWLNECRLTLPVAGSTRRKTQEVHRP